VQGVEEEAERMRHNRGEFDGGDAEDRPLHEEGNGEDNAAVDRVVEGAELVSRSLRHATLRLSFPIKPEALPNETFQRHGR